MTEPAKAKNPHDPRWPLDLPQQEAFAQARARGLDHRAAYVAAGYKAHKYKGAKLQRREHVKERIEVLAEQFRWSGTRAIAPVIDALADLANKIVKALEKRPTAAGVGAARSLYVEIARLKGLLPPDAPIETLPPIEIELSDEEWTRRYGAPAP
jgi:hypothetical protein